MRKTSTQLEKLKRPRRMVKSRDSLLAQKPAQPKAKGFTTPRKKGGRGA